MLPGKIVFILGVLSAFLWGCCGPDLYTEDEIRGQDIRPYVGLVRNFSNVDISIPSHDSNSTLILPAQGQMEYTVWQPNVDISGYVDGKQVYFKNIRISPNTKYSYFGKNYDFLAEVCPDLHGPAIVPRTCPPAWQLEPSPKPRRGISS